MKPPIEITEVVQNDVRRLQEIGRRTFFETFAASNTEENMKTYLDEGFSTEKLVAELDDSNSEFYFALSESEPVGYLKLNFGTSQTERKDDRAVEIERIYVLRDFQGKQVGQMLYDKAMEIAWQKGADYLWLGVWEKNDRAIRFYRKNGFVPFGRHVFRLGEDEQTDLMMKRTLDRSRVGDYKGLAHNCF